MIVCKATLAMNSQIKGKIKIWSTMPLITSLDFTTLPNLKNKKIINLIPNKFSTSYTHGLKKDPSKNVLWG